MMRVRIRGIYATALTQRLQDTAEIVRASPVIDDRFSVTFSTTPPDVTIETTPDRQGIEVSGHPDAVPEIVSQVEEVGRDAVAWDDPAPRGAVFEGTVRDTVDSGALVDLGPRDGFLSFGAVDGYISEGDTVTVQVHEPAAPWLDRRPELATEIRVFGTLVDLVQNGGEPRADVADPDRATELVRTTAVLSTAVPEGWTVCWQPAAAEASMEQLDEALAFVCDRIPAVEAALEDGGLPLATAWVWFGRESRFVLDADRREVCPTMPGHHRIKAGSDAAGSAVDFVEQLCDPAGEFPFEVVADVFGPREGEQVTIVHGKPDGRQFPLGEGTVVDRDGQTLTVQREMTAGGEYDALEVAREAGDTATTKLREGRWWYPTVYRDADGAVKGTYVNVCTPVELFPDAAVYMDLEIDVVRHRDGVVERVDEEDLAAAVSAGHLSEALAKKARSVAKAVEAALAD